MLNQCILVGKLQKDPQLNTLPDGRTQTVIELAIQRGYKNAETGDYDTDIIPITLWSGIAESTVEYCKAGATIGVKARLKQQEYAEPDGNIFTYPEVIAEKVTFINTKGDE
jgi:single-strand DNA-binding protein